MHPSASLLDMSTPNLLKMNNDEYDIGGGMMNNNLNGGSNSSSNKNGISTSDYYCSYYEIFFYYFTSVISATHTYYTEYIQSSLYYSCHSNY